MKRLNIELIISGLLLSLFWSCTETVDVDVPNGGERLVVEATILWEKGTTGEEQTIKLSKSTEYFSSDLDVPATGASVRVVNENSGEEFVFADQNDGTYTTNSFVPVIDDPYALEIVYNGATYTANETLMSVVEITSIEQELSSGFDGDEIRIKVYYNDPQDIANFYLGEFIPSDLPLLSLDPSDDEFYDGNQNFLEYDDENLASGDLISVNLHGISERFYDYIDLLASQVGDGGPFQTTPAQLRGNCINVNDPNEEVLGYFRLSEVDKIEYTVN